MAGKHFKFQSEIQRQLRKLGTKIWVHADLIIPNLIDLTEMSNISTNSVDHLTIFIKCQINHTSALYMTLQNHSKWYDFLYPTIDSK